MSLLSPPRPPARATEQTRQTEHTPTTRWHSLDVLKGVALWAMVAHHLQKWVGGDLDDRFLGFDTFLITDLAAPVFAVALGAAAVVVGARVRTWPDLRRPVWRWTQILILGLLIDLVTHGVIEGRGVLPTLAVLGFVITLAVAAGGRGPWGWWAVAGTCALAAVPATEVVGDGPLHLLLNGPFSLPVYGVFAASGAAVATHGLGRSEGSLPLVRSAVAVLVVGLVAAAVAGGLVAPDGIWTPTRYPGHLSFTLWGLVASLVVWALARGVLRAGTVLGEATARAGRRTLLVFAAHFVVKVALQHAGWLGELDSWRWGLVTWGAIVAICAISAAPVGAPRSRATIVTP